MKISASDITYLYLPSICEKRLYLRETQPGLIGEPSPFEQLLNELGQRHEKRCLDELLKEYQLTDTGEGEEQDRLSATKEALESGAELIYHGLLLAELEIEGHDLILVGEPDFIIRTGDGHVIREAKLARHVDDKRHPEITAQIQIYGLLLEEVTGSPPPRLEVVAGDGTLAEMPYDRGAAERELAAVVLAIKAEEEPYSPVGWSKCGDCDFHEICWDAAVRSRDVAILPGVDQGLALKLRDMGVTRVEELAEKYREDELSELKRPWGKGERKVGKTAGKIMSAARATLNDLPEKLVEEPQIPESRFYVMFDVESIPPQLEDLEKVYLWGIQAFSYPDGVPGEYMASPAGVGDEADKRCWEEFLENADRIFEEYGDVPFVHWSSYEKTCINHYVERYGDRKGTAARVLDNLLDLMKAVKDAVALPIPSYSLKVVEGYVGFQRSMDEFGGDWSIAQYIRAVESEDDEERKRLLDDIVLYNREDLLATWETLKWLMDLFEG